MVLGPFWPIYSVNRAVRSTSKLEKRTNDQCLQLHIIVILYWCKRCCHSLVLLCYCHHDADIFQQESAPAHHARQTIELLQSETMKFTGPDLWTHNSPNLNPADYRIFALANLLSEIIMVRESFFYHCLHGFHIMWFFQYCYIQYLCLTV